MSSEKNVYTGDEDFDELIDKALRVMKTKSVDYAQEGDRLAQFRRAAKKYNVSMRTVLAIYMDKHLASMEKWLGGEDLKGEPVEEKFLDMVVYSLLGYKIAKEERAATDVEASTPSLTPGTHGFSVVCDCSCCDRVAFFTFVPDIRDSRTDDNVIAEMKQTALCDGCMQEPHVHTNSDLDGQK